MARIVVFGPGFLGERMAREIPGATLSRADITDKAAVLAALREARAEAVINAAGKTGRPNVDWCESHQAETYRANVGGALTLADACAEAGAALVLMHTRAEPKKKEFPEYDDVVADVVAFLRQRMAEAVARGVPEDAIVLDPGPDFAKTPAQTVAVLRRLDALAALGRPLLLAVSRKDFIGALTQRTPRQRDAGTLAAIGAGVDAGASILRVHDVAAVHDYLTVRAALRGDVAVPDDLHLPVELRRERG